MLLSCLDHYSSLSLECPTDTLKENRYLCQRRVFRSLKGLNHFLKELNPQFERRRGVMCHLPALPSLDEVVASMEREEIRQEVMFIGTSSAARSALAIPNAPIAENRDCYTCGRRDI